MPILLTPKDSSLLSGILALMKKWANEWGIACLGVGAGGVFGTVAVAATIKQLWWTPLLAFSLVFLVLAGFGAFLGYQNAIADDVDKGTLT